MENVPESSNLAIKRRNMLQKLGEKELITDLSTFSRPKNGINYMFHIS
jgi:hypothetical protein